MEMGSLQQYLADVANVKAFEFRRQEVVLKVARNTVGTSSDSYKTPSDVLTVIEQVRGHLAFLDFANEDAVNIGALTDTSAMGRIFAKAMNCRVRLKDLDAKLSLFTGHAAEEALSLASCIEFIGGTPFKWQPPHIIKPGHTVQMDAELVSAAAGVLGGSTEYGLILSVIEVFVGQ